MTFSPDAVLEVLERHRVRYVVIGGMAATLHGSPMVTFDIDVVPERSKANLERLSTALGELDARIRVEGIDGGLEFTHDATSLTRMNVVNLVTIHGDLDLTFSPAGVSTFEEWDEHATDVEALGVHFRLADLDQVIASKEAADRPKDRAALPILRALAERRRRR
ncbi:MAG: DUF6036 family nucleotidyltransferase [Acidimicrobiales bacterium]